MSGALLTDQGLRLRLAATLDRPLWFRLYANDPPVLPASVLDDFQPAAFPDYADQELTGLWSAPVIDVLGRASSGIDGLTFERGAGGLTETVFGWLIFEEPDPDSQLVCAKRLTVPKILAVEGQSVMVSLVVYLLRG